MLEDTEKPPTSKEEADARRVRPPPEKYDPDKLPDWSITMTVAWIIWREIDAVRNECDDYREKCSDWKAVSTARTKLLIPDLQKELKESPWDLQQWEYSGWRGLRSRARPENPQVAIGELWRAAREDRTKAIAREYKNDKAYVGDPIKIPAHHWPYLKCIDDPLTGKAMLSYNNGRVYREVLFPRLAVKELWPKSPPLSGEHAETWPSHLALIQLIESTTWDGPFRSEADEPEKPEPKSPKEWLHDARKDNRQWKNERPIPYILRLHGLMQEANNVTEVWGNKNFRRRYYEAVKAERQAAPKKRKSPRTV